MFFQGWSDLGRLAAVGIMVYPLLVVTVRISGRRTLAEMNAFDLVGTVALGSTLATILLSRDVSLAEGGLALALLVILQFIATWVSVRSRWACRLLKSQPSVVLETDGSFSVGSATQAGNRTALPDSAADQRPQSPKNIGSRRRGPDG